MAQNETQKSAKETYEEGVSTYKAQNPFAQSVAEFIINKFDEKKTDPKISQLMSQIQAAGAAFNIEEVLRLSTELNNIKDASANDKQVIEHLRKAGFQTAMKAFDKEFSELAHEIALEVQKRIHASKATAKPAKQADGSGLLVAPKVDAGEHTIKAGKDEFKVETGLTGRVNWANHSKLLEALKIPFTTKTVNKKAVVKLSVKGFKLSKSDDKLYKPSLAAIVGGVKNGVYEGVTLAS